MVSEPMKNHPGWAKGRHVRLRSGMIVELLEDGVFKPFSDGSVVGYLWHYKAKWPDGFERVIVPEVGDKILEEEKSGE